MHLHGLAVTSASPHSVKMCSSIFYPVLPHLQYPLDRLLHLRVRNLPLGVPHILPMAIIKNSTIIRRIPRSGSRVDYAKLMRDKERRAGSQSFLPKQAKPRKFRDEITEQMEVAVLDKEVAGERAEMAGTDLKELKEKMSDARNKTNDSGRLSSLRETRQETGQEHRKRISNMQ
ncbi:hypothetical protein BYT27DRAFT_7254227 [Phlegmacium glaucopus]|nr:hypothetical protein BYT27DRAFT_7254227 [Phlegmacium glaucopus]